MKTLISFFLLLLTFVSKISSTTTLRPHVINKCNNDSIYLRIEKLEVIPAIDPISIVTTGYTLLSRGFDLYKNYKQLRIIKRSPLESNEFQATMKNYFSSVNQRLDIISEQNRSILNTINENNTLLKVVIEKTDAIQNALLDREHSNIEASMNSILNTEDSEKRQNRFNYDRTIFLASVYQLIENEYRIDKILKLPMYMNFYLVNSDFRNINKNFTSLEKEELLNRLSNKISQINNGLDSINDKLIKSLMLYSYWIGSAHNNSVIDDSEYNRLMSIKLKNSDPIGISVNVHSKGVSNWDTIRKKIEARYTDITSTRTFLENYSLLVGALELYRQSISE